MTAARRSELARCEQRAAHGYEVSTVIGPRGVRHLATGALARAVLAAGPK